MIHAQSAQQLITPSLTATYIKSIAPKPEGFVSLCISNDKLVLGSMKSKVKIYSLSQHKQIHTITAYSSKVKAMFVFKNLFFSGQEGEDGIIKVWEMEKFQLVRVLKGHTDTVQMITGLSQSTIVSASVDKTVRVWDISKPQQTVYVLEHEYPVLVVQCVNKDLLVSGGDDCLLILWEWAKEIKLKTVFAHACSVSCLIVKDGELISAGGDGIVRFWSIDDFVDQTSNTEEDEEKKRSNQIQLSEDSIDHCCLYENGVLFVDDGSRMFLVNGHASQEIQISIPYHEIVTGLLANSSQIIVITNENDAQIFEIEQGNGVNEGDVLLEERSNVDNSLNEVMQIRL